MLCNQNPDMISTAEICQRDACTSCAACVNICNHDAVKLIEDELGFTYPQIDHTKCVECNACRIICPVLNPLKLCNPLEVYAAISDNEHELMSSSSGGAASVISRYILDTEGVVYGCSQKNYLNIKHVRICQKFDLHELKGSKYVQSDIGLSYRQVKRDLLDDKSVLFVGTPCQIAGLKNYLRKDYDNLYTIDLVCHGVASKKMLCEDIDQYKTAYNINRNEDIFVTFRWKTKSGIRYGIQLYHTIGGKKKMIKSIRFPYDPYITAFMEGLSFRENCHQCVYGRKERIGDLTIGDFWGLGAYQSTGFNTKNGVSLLMINTHKGERLLGQVKEQFILEKRELAEAVSGNANLQSALIRPLNKDIFKEILVEKGLSEACRVALPRKRYYRLVLTEELKRITPLVTLFKKIRLVINQCKSR